MTLESRWFLTGNLLIWAAAEKPGQTRAQFNWWEETVTVQKQFYGTIQGEAALLTAEDEEEEILYIKTIIL